MISVSQGPNIRDIIFQSVKKKKYTAHLTAQNEGILSGSDWLKKSCKKLGIYLEFCQKDGSQIEESEVVAIVKGEAKQMASAEEELLGWLSKASGIATAAWVAKKAAGKKLKVVSGAWKKMPLPIKDLIRQAITDGGIYNRIAEVPFLYLDKNYIRMLGGVQKAMQLISHLKGYKRVVQLKGEEYGISEEGLIAARGGANIIMIDTGKKEDIKRVDSILRAKGLRDNIQIAFGGNIKIEDLKELRRMPVEIVDIGQAIVDAPLLDFRMDVIPRQ